MFPVINTGASGGLGWKKTTVPDTSPEPFSSAIANKPGFTTEGYPWKEKNHYECFPSGCCEFDIRLWIVPLSHD